MPDEVEARMDGGGGTGGSGSGPENRSPFAWLTSPQKSQRRSQQCREERGPDCSDLGQGLEVLVVDVLLHLQPSIPLRFDDQATRTDAGERMLSEHVQGRCVQARARR